ncbi:MAG: AAA family ATPase [Rhabdochlamydiaceae bacterium]|nr:AAA family ATPase [Rhabdochlamydiaceae bacterium]
MSESILNKLPSVATFLGVATLTDIAIQRINPSYSKTQRIASSLLYGNLATFAFTHTKLMTPLVANAWIISNLVTLAWMVFFSPNKVVHAKNNFSSEKEISHCLRKVEKVDGKHTAFVEQAEQIQRAIGSNQVSKHVMVSGCEDHLESVLSLLDKEVFVLNAKQLRPSVELEQRLVSFFTVDHPNSIVYVPSLDPLNQQPTENEELVLGYFQRVITRSESFMVGPITRVYDRTTVGSFKIVDLKPLSQEKVLQEITEFAQDQEYNSNEKALSVAVEAAFLLHKGNGKELAFVRDLIERAGNNRGKQVTVESVWTTFKTLYLTVKRFEEEEKQLNPLHESKLMSLVRIAMALRKKYETEFVCDPVQLSHPPELLRDLNEELKDKNEFAIDVGGRIGMLTDALQGQYQNALIIGHSGVGKTTLVKQAAWMAAHGEFPEGHPLHGKTIYSLNSTSIMAGAKYAGTFEGRIEKIFNYLMQNKNGVLFIDEIHLLMGSGATKGNEMGTVAQNLKTYLEESGIMVIGATTEREFEAWIAPDIAFVRRFNLLSLNDVSDTQAVQALTQYADSETFGKIKNGLQINQQLIENVVKEAKKQKADVGLIDRAKKLLEKRAHAERH